MSILGRLSRLFRSGARPKSKTKVPVLNPLEIEWIAEGNMEKLVAFSTSSRLHAVSPEGDTPLHLSARMGNLAVCDLFIRSGADPRLLNHNGQTPAEVAFAEGHTLAAQFLFSLIATSLPSIGEHDDLSQVKVGRMGTEVAATRQSLSIASKSEMNDTIDDLDALPAFEAEVEPEEFFGHHAGEAASGTFVALVSSSLVIPDANESWDLDLSPVQIAGEGIGSSVVAVSDHDGEHDFLKVRKRGRQSVRRAIVQTGTRLSIDPEICKAWAKTILTKGWCSFDDVDQLAILCEGNGDLDMLRINLKHTLEAAGFNLIDPINDCEAHLWDVRSTISSDELAEAIEATLSRKTRLPGTQRFVMDKDRELRLLEPMVMARQELQLGILASKTAVKIILEAFDNIRDGLRSPGSVSLRTLFPSRPDHAETVKVLSAVETLKVWQLNGRVMDGKPRRKALAALATLDLSLAFQKELVSDLEREEPDGDHCIRLDGLISIYETANRRLILEHLPYARRFAARNVENAENSEDIFQVAFTGLQQSTRRFDPERGVRFLVYCTFWMKQALTRWRADKVAMIRVPIHRYEKLMKLDRAFEHLDVRVDGAVTDDDLAAELEWPIDEVRQFRSIPRKAEYPESIDDWNAVLPEPEEDNAFDQAETEMIVADVLSELSDREADVIRMRFGIGYDAEMTLEEIGQIYGVTRERIRQIEAKSLKHLSHPERKRRLQVQLGI